MIINTFEIAKQEDIGAALQSMRGGTAMPSGTFTDVQEIINAVRDRGDEALLEMTRRYDGVDLEAGELEITTEQGRRALEALDESARSTLEKAERRIADFARQSLEPDWEMEVGRGIRVGQVRRPLDSAGIYVPGGRFAYPSTVLMTGVPAREAGVGSIVFCIPPEMKGTVNKATLAATRLVGECRVFRVGGAQAIAAMAFGTDTIPKSRMVAGPGNIYVAAAKRLLSTMVTIDLEAGPSEIAALIDGSNDVSFPVSDVLAQLEHDPLALAVLVSESSDVLETAAGVASGLCEGAASGENGTLNLVRCASRGLSVEFLNELAPEHLELMVPDAQDILPSITSAGCVFIGPYSAVVMGDYLAGPSHVLPTGGTANRLSGLSVLNFQRTMNVISYTREGFLVDAPDAGLFARLETLEKHALSVDIRTS